jgi:hypothetical protein
MFGRAAGGLCVVSCLLVGACGNATDPTQPTKSDATLTHEPTAGATLTIGSPFKVSYTLRQFTPVYTYYALSFVRDDGAFSPPLACGRTGAAGTSQGTGTGFVTGTLAAGVVGADWKGNILYQFAQGHRVNAVMLLKDTFPAFAPPGFGCDPLSTDMDPNRPPTEGAVFPAAADQRVDVTLNWLIQQ